MNREWLAKAPNDEANLAFVREQCSADAVLGRFAPALLRGTMNVILEPLTVSVLLFHLIVESTLFRPKTRQILCVPCPLDVEATDLKASLG